MHAVLVSSAPTRLDFGGGWTDVPPFPEERGGFVCNLAINRRATVTVRARDLNTAPSDEVPLVSAARRRAMRDGQDLAGLQIDIASDFPVSAGLGGSSAAGVALAAALAAHAGQSREPRWLAEWSRAVEVEELGVAGGRQDHYAAAFGGALGLTFGAETVVERIEIDVLTRQTLEQRCLLVYTGESRISASTISAVLNAYADRTPRVLNALDRMKALARQMRDALARGDVDALAAHVDEHWVHQRSLHPQITTPRIDQLEVDARGAGATAVKALGASGGGCVIVFTPLQATAAVSRAVSAWGDLLPWRVDTTGATIARHEPSSDGVMG